MKNSVSKSHDQTIVSKVPSIRENGDYVRVKSTGILPSVKKHGSEEPIELIRPLGMKKGYHTADVV